MALGTTEIVIIIVVVVVVLLLLCCLCRGCKSGSSGGGSGGWRWSLLSCQRKYWQSSFWSLWLWLVTCNQSSDICRYPFYFFIFFSWHAFRETFFCFFVSANKNSLCLLHCFCFYSQNLIDCFRTVFWALIGWIGILLSPFWLVEVFFKKLTPFVLNCHTV